MRAVPPRWGGEEESPPLLESAASGLGRWQRQRFQGLEMLPGPWEGSWRWGGVEVVVERSESSMAGGRSRKQSVMYLVFGMVAGDFLTCISCRPGAAAVDRTYWLGQRERGLEKTPLHFLRRVVPVKRVLDVSSWPCGEEKTAEE